jgi:hypothetical protein
MERFFWESLRRDVREFVRECNKCELNKNTLLPRFGELKPIDTSRPGQIYTTDLVGPLPETTSGNKYILAVCDHYTKWAKLYGLKEISAPTVAKFLVEFFMSHGIPEAVLSDRGTNFLSHVITEIFDLLNIRRLKKASFHAQTDGLTERVNRTLKEMLRHFVN